MLTGAIIRESPIHSYIRTLYFIYEHTALTLQC